MFSPDTRILIVDDSLSMRLNIRNMLSNLGFKDIIEAVDGNKAWEALQQSTPAVQLVLSDQNMPDCTGMDFLKKVRSDETFKKLPFIMVTSEGEKSMILSAINAGVSNYITKPVDAETLRKKLEATAEKLGI
jgi:two-component system chemotaxis response regulator CheY